MAPARKFVTHSAMNHRRAGGLDPILTRKSRTSHKGVLVLVVAFVLFVAYVNNVGGLKMFADGLFDNWNQSAHSQNGAVVTAIATVFPYIVGLLLLVVVVSVIRGLVGKGQDFRKQRRLGKREEVAMEDFIDESVEHGVSAKVAREAYRLLQEICSDCMRARFSDDLKYDLHLERSDVTNMYAALVKKSDRMLRAESMMAPYTTVLDVMMAVERSPVRSAGVQAERPKRGIRLDSFVRPSYRPGREGVKPPAMPGPSA